MVARPSSRSTQHARGTNMRCPRRLALMLLIFSVVVPLAPSALAAQTDVLYTFDIPAQPLGAALESFTEITGWVMAGDATGAAASTQSRAVKGRLSARDALSEMLLGTGLGFTQ